MSKQTFRVGQLVTFKYGTRDVRGVVKEDRGPIGMKGRVLYLVEFRPETQSPYASRIELPADRLKKVESSEEQRTNRVMFESGGSMAEHTSAALGYPVIDLPESVAVSSESVIQYMIEHLVEKGRISREHAARAACHVVTRENQGSTALGRGVAMPHSKSDVAGVVGLIGRSQKPLPWQPSDGVPVREVRLLLTPVDQPHEAMQAMKDTAAVLPLNSSDISEPKVAPDCGGTT